MVLFLKCSFIYCISYGLVFPCLIVVSFSWKMNRVSVGGVFIICCENALWAPSLRLGEHTHSVFFVFEEFC